MKAHNRLNEIHKIAKYNRYIDKKLIPEVNKALHLDLKKSIGGDIYTIVYKSFRDESDEVLDITLKFTTNNRNNDGLFWATFIIAGRTVEVGSIIGDINYDLGIIEDSYYYFFEQVEAKGQKLTGI